MDDKRLAECERIIKERFQCGEYDHVGDDLLQEVKRLRKEIKQLRPEAYAEGVLSERAHTSRAIAEADILRVRAESAERELITTRANNASNKGDP